MTCRKRGRLGMDPVTLLMDSMVDYRRNGHVITIQDQNILVKVRPSPQRSTFGWFICIQWKYGSISWCKLSDMKAWYPVETSEYTVAQGINDESDYNWWVVNVLRKRYHTISAVNQRNTKYTKRPHKFGIEVTKTIAEAIDLGKRNGDTLWKDVIVK